ncbi:uncharacterized protein LOC126457285 isoform X1 [Schistocerca serialis cubense]|uniref:uncharacterized protein LOC126457285 isoform X1 n=2 Tax=Schistocerca serialis cubense TaxID=2023355 RepID=UPI00214ED1FD|nr:uncharacterized protein LOC126457285 isoform X1 [Schistocerca serialis cubense]
MHTVSHNVKMRRTLSGSCAIGVFVIALVCVAVAFCAPSWLVSDYRITGAKLNQLGLWSHCFRSLPQPDDEFMRRFFVGCRWIYDPFTTGYDEIQGFLVPGFMIATQFFFTLCFLCILAAFFLVLLYFLCWGPEQTRYILLIIAIGALLMAAGINGGIAVIVFASLGNRNDWMPGQENNFLGWAFGLAVVGVVAAFVSGTLFLAEANIQRKKRKHIQESQSRFEMEHESKA